MYLRNGGTQKVYWHGPSIGSDVGADGSRTLFLIYRLNQPEDLYRQFTGIDGTAYLVGGVGLTFLKGGPVVMAPIRSGIGLRFGASLGISASHRTRRGTLLIGPTSFLCRLLNEKRPGPLGSGRRRFDETECQVLNTQYP